MRCILTALIRFQRVIWYLTNLEIYFGCWWIYFSVVVAAGKSKYDFWLFNVYLSMLHMKIEHLKVIIEWCFFCTYSSDSGIWLSSASDFSLSVWNFWRRVRIIGSVTHSYPLKRSPPHHSSPLSVQEDLKVFLSANRFYGSALDLPSPLEEILSDSLPSNLFFFKPFTLATAYIYSTWY